jgi:hypothetical protein
MGEQYIPAKKCQECRWNLYIVLSMATLTVIFTIGFFTFGTIAAVLTHKGEEKTCGYITMSTLSAIAAIFLFIISICVVDENKKHFAVCQNKQ